MNYVDALLELTEPSSCPRCHNCKKLLTFSERNDGCNLCEACYQIVMDDDFGTEEESA